MHLTLLPGKDLLRRRADLATSLQYHVDSTTLSHFAHLDLSSKA